MIWHRPVEKGMGPAGRRVGCRIGVGQLLFVAPRDNWKESLDA